MAGIDDEVQRQIALAIRDVAYNSSVALTNADEVTGKPTQNHGSGVLVEIAGRIFVATVAHVRQVHMSHLDVMIPGRKATHWPRILKRHGERARGVDLVWFELDPGDIAPAVPAPLTRIRTEPLRTGETVFVTGYPGANRELHDGQLGDGVTAGFFTFPTPLVHAESLSFAWDRDHLVPTPGAPSLPPTAGMSGGGVWTYRTGRPGDPTPFVVQARLVGLVREERTGYREARANPIGGWLEMLAADVPELAKATAPYR